MYSAIHILIPAEPAPSATCLCVIYSLPVCRGSPGHAVPGGDMGTDGSSVMEIIFRRGIIYEAVPMPEHSR